MTLNSKTDTTNVNVDDVVLNGILELVKKNNTRVWSGTMTDLNAALVKVVGKGTSSMLPGSPAALGIVTNRIINRLRNRKVKVQFTRTNDRTRTRLVKFVQ